MVSAVVRRPPPRTVPLNSLARRESAYGDLCWFAAIAPRLIKSIRRPVCTEGKGSAAGTSVVVGLLLLTGPAERTAKLPDSC
jgi:hypothetical protein